MGTRVRAEPRTDPRPAGRLRDRSDGTRTEPASLVDVHRTVLEPAGLDGDRRGQNLLRDLDVRDRLTEHHGLTGRTRELLREHGYDEEGQRHDTLLRGFASESDYVYETLDGVDSQFGSGLDDAEDGLEELVEDLDVRPVSAGHSRDVPEDVEQRLEKLGYV